MKKERLTESFRKVYNEGLQYGKGSNPPTEKDEEIAEKFCVLMDWEITPDDIWQVYDYGDGKATISVSKDMNATMTDGEVSDLDDVYYFDYENDYIISKESEDLAKMQNDEDEFEAWGIVDDDFGPESSAELEEFKKIDGIRIKEGSTICARCGEPIAPGEVEYRNTLIGRTPFHKECFEADIEDEDWQLPPFLEDEYADEIDDYYYDDRDPADRDMGEMYGNYRGDASFFESKPLTHERLMEATIGERLSNIGRAIKDGLSDIFDTGMIGGFALHQADDVAEKFWKHLKALQSGFSSIVDRLYYDIEHRIRINDYEIGDMFPSEAKILGGEKYLDETYWKDSNWRLADLIKFELLSGGDSWTKELKWVDKSYKKSIDIEKISPKEFFAMFTAKVEELAEKDLDNKTKKDVEKTQKKLDKENHISKKDRELTQMRKDFLGESKLSEGGYTTFTNHIGEKDSFYDPYKKEPADVPYEPIFASEDYKGRFFKGLDFTTKEGLEKAADRWSDYYYSDFIHDIGHDGDKAGARSASIALNSLLKEIKHGAVLLGLTEDDVNGPLKDIIKNLRDAWKRHQAAEKRRLTKEANKENRAKAYAEELRNTDLPPELKELFADDGFYKERRSWGTIKDYFNEPYGKALKQLWVNQFGK